MKKIPDKMHKICGDCYHFAACQMWNIGGLANTDSENCVNFEPAADVRPVVHGEWVPDDRGITVRCSECGAAEWYIARGKFCSNCGAQMEVEEDE